MTTFTPAVEQLNVYLFQLINAPAAFSAGMLRVGTFFASDTVALFPLVLLFNWFWRGEAQKKAVLYALFSMILALAESISPLVWSRSYAHFWCMGFRRWWRILLIDFVNDFNNREMICHEKV